MTFAAGRKHPGCCGPTLFASVPAGVLASLTHHQHRFRRTRIDEAHAGTR